MPEKFWKHACCGDDGALTSCRTCPRCGKPGTFQGWFRSMHEGMAAYVRTFGLKPVGPHRKLADRLLGSLRSPCARCGGAGIVGDERGYRECRLCEGGGGIWTASDADILAAYKRILLEYPDSAAPGGPIPGIWQPARPLPDRRAGKRKRRSERKRRPRFDESTLTDVQRAFVEAERRLGRKWPLKGRGHCRRATLKNRYACSVHRVTSCWERLMPQGTSSRRTLYPLAIILEAAGILGVELAELMGKEY